MTSGRVIWITGLSGAGKSALAGALRERLAPRPNGLVVLDGDRVREVFGSDLGYLVEDRLVQVRRIQALSLLLAEQGLVVIVAVLYGTRELWAWNRVHLPGYFEIHLRALPQTLRSRRDLYARAERGEERNVVGSDIPWQPPLAPDLELDGDGGLSPAELADRALAAFSWVGEGRR